MDATARSAAAHTASTPAVLRGALETARSNKENMMRWFVGTRIGIAAAIAATGAGCSTISTDSTLQDLLNASGLGSVTVGDVLNAIQDFTGQDVALPFGQTLTADQESQITALQDQLNAGKITGQDYVT